MDTPNWRARECSDLGYLRVCHFRDWKAKTFSHSEETKMKPRITSTPCGFPRNVRLPGNAAAFFAAFWRRCGILLALSSLLLLATPKSWAAVTLLDALTSNTNESVNSPLTCVVPPSVTSFTATSKQVWVYFDLNGAQPGDTVAIKWYRPDGTLYTTLGSNFTVPTPGYVCGFYYITLASASGAAYLGTWTIQTFYNGSSVPLFSLNFTVAPVNLLDAVITSVNPSGVGNTVSCSSPVPSSVNTFATTAPQVWVYSDFNGASAGDTVAVNWYRPDGVIYQTSGTKQVFSPGANGYQCFAYYITLAGAAAANYPGTWTILAYYNGSSTPLFSLNFTVGSGPLTAVQFTEYTIPVVASNDNNPAPMRIAVGPDSALWFTNNNSGYIGRITTTGTITQYSTGTTGGGCPQGITTGPDGNLWFIETCGDSGSPGGYIGRSTPSGAVSHFSAPSVNSQMSEIALGPDGNLWFSDGGTSSIGRIIPGNSLTAAPNITEFSCRITGNCVPGFITAGPDGKVWFTAGDIYNATTATKPVITDVGPGSGTKFDIGTSAGITTGPDGALWVLSQQQVERVTTSGSFTLIQQLPNSLSAAVGIVKGPDSALWFTDGGANNIGRITPDGKTFNEFPVPTVGANPLWITAGPDGALWFVEQVGNKIGRITVPGAPPSVPDNGVTDGAGFSAKISGGGIGSIFGTNLAAATAVATTVPLPTTLAGVTVTMDGTPVPLFFVSPLQINFQVPWQLIASSTATLAVTTAFGASTSITVNLSAAAPGIFTFNTANSATQGAIQIANTITYVAPVGAVPGATSRPATTGDILTIFCSGLGAVSNTPGSGSGAGSGSSLSNVVAQVSVTIGGQTAPFLFAGLSPGFVGLYQVNVQFPTGVAPGNAVPVIVTTAGLKSNTATIAVQ
jgi:virginiamycin B lyase